MYMYMHSVFMIGIAFILRPPERQAADINYVIFECPTRHDTSLLYKPLLFARNSGQPSNASSRLLAEYWSSAASTVDSMMYIKGSTQSGRALAQWPLM